MAGNVIPNQRVDRIVKFAEALQNRIAALEEEFVKSQITNENFTDLIEEGIRQAARSLSDERREYISSIIANSLTSKDIEFVESKHLMRILGEITILRLSGFAFSWSRLWVATRSSHQAQEYYYSCSRLHGITAKVHDKASLQQSYKEHLAPWFAVSNISQILKRSSLNMITKGA